MKLLLQNNQLTRYAKSGDYATTTAIPLTANWPSPRKPFWHGSNPNWSKASQSAKCS
jgi:hypothetical protein